MGPSGRFTHGYVILDCLGQVGSWVELPVQRRLCSIFVRDVGSPDIHEYFHGLTSSQRTPRIWGVTNGSSSGGNFVTSSLSVFTSLISSWLKYFCPLLSTLLNRGPAILLKVFIKVLA